MMVTTFFQELFMNPGMNTTAVYIIAGSTVASAVGLAFLIKLIYNRCCPERTGAPIIS